MTFSHTLVKQGVMGDLAYEIRSFNAASVTSGNIVTGLRNIKMTAFLNKTAQRGTVDDSTTAGTVALTNLTSGDVGTVMVFGNI